MRSFRKATVWMVDGSLRDASRWNSLSVSLDLKLLIMAN
jgi:hypothetical protein